jgi:hypothetical protein
VSATERILQALRNLETANKSLEASQRELLTAVVMQRDDVMAAKQAVEEQSALVMSLVGQLQHVLRDQLKAAARREG